MAVSEFITSPEQSADAVCVCVCVTQNSDMLNNYVTLLEQSDTWNWSELHSNICIPTVRVWIKLPYKI
jgi:hypothetical protein